MNTAWTGLIGGVALGGLIWGTEGAATLGFLGWLAGFIHSQRSQKRQPQTPGPQPQTPGPQPQTPGPGTGQVLGTGVGQVPTATPQDRSSWTMEDRVARLEATVARLEAQLAGAAAAPPRAELGSRAIAAGAAPGTTSQEAPGPSELGSRAIAAGAAPGTTSHTAPETTSHTAPGTTSHTAPGTTSHQPPETTSHQPPGTKSPKDPNPLLEWFAGVNTIARIGLVILFIGLAFLLKYAADQRLLPPELRVIAVAAGGLALLFLGWRLRFKNEAYALGLQGAGVAVLYLTTFGALRLYKLLPPELAFFVLAGIAVFSAILAVRQDAVALAVIGAGGGFLAPILASTGKGSHVMLFTYYLILNGGILAIAWYKAWRSLNLTGFVFTFAIFWLWGYRSYAPEHYASTQPFLIAFFVLYVALAILIAREKSEPGARRYVDGTIVFGVPLAAFALQAELVGDTEYGLAISALVVSAFYIGFAWALLRSAREGWKLLAQAFIALGVVFATVAIPLALDARWTSASWAAEGAAILWICLKQKRTVGRAFGLLLQLLAAIAYFHGYEPHGPIPIADAAFLGAAIIALAGLWAHRLFLAHREDITATEAQFTLPLFIWGVLWTLWAGLDEIDAHVPGDYSLAAAVAFLAFVAIKFAVLSRRWDWRPAAWTAKLLLPALYVGAAIYVAREPHPFAGGGWLAWPFAFAVLAWILRKIDPDDTSANATAIHAGTAILVALLGAVELHWVAAQYTAHGTAWSAGAAAFVPAFVVLVISLQALDDHWPVERHPAAYRLHAVTIIAGWLALWSIFTNYTHDARSDPLPYMPIINALDLVHIFAALALVAAWKAAQRSAIEPPEFVRLGVAHALAGFVGFLWLTAILLRTASRWDNVPYQSSAMMKSMVVQSSLSIFWAVLALAAMVFATRTGRRPIWIVGAVLMGVVVAKLFLIDLSNVAGIERIVSFIAVGVLMLVIGYVSPMPPRKAENQQPENQ